MRRRTLFGIGLALLVLLAAQTALFAQAKYPSKPITFIVPFGASGASDLCFRTLLEDLKAHFGQPVTIVNKPGAGGLTGADFVANSKPDGYTLLAGTSSGTTVAPAIDPRSARDIVPIAVLANQATLLVVNADGPYKTLEDFLAKGKSKKNAVTTGTTGVQSIPYFDLALLETGAGVEISHMPIADSAEGMSNLLGGHIDSWFGTVSVAQNLLRAGKLRGLGTCNPVRLSEFKDIPTFAEKGYPGVNINLMMILYAPKGTPAEVFKAWEEALTVVMAKPEIQSALNKLNFEVDFQVGSANIQADLDRQRQDLVKIVQQRGIKP